MTDKRSDDAESKTFFRSERITQHAGQWFFTTREGTIQGPFESKAEARKELNEYIKIMIATGEGKLTLAPKDPLFSIQ